MRQKKAEDIALELGFRSNNYYNAAQQMLQQDKFGIVQQGVKNI